MKKLLPLFMFCFVCSVTYAQNTGGTGVGIIVGNPTGLSLKHWLGGNTAFDAAAAWSFNGNGYLQLHADYLLHNFTMVEREWPVYYGIGAVVGIGDDVGLAVRVPVGISYLFPSSPLDAFLEVVPRLDLVPSTDFRLDAAIGVRYYFNR